MEIIFKSMELNDLEKTIDLCNLCFDEKTSYDTARSLFLKQQSDCNNIYLNGVINGEVIAHLKMTIIETIYDSMDTYAILNHVCVHPKYQRHHIATHLLNVAFKIAKDRNCKTVKLWSMNFRQAAHKCYLNYGFEIVDAKFFAKKV